MAEYCDVMAQKLRMCHSFAFCSDGCPLNELQFCGKNTGEEINADFPKVEKAVMKWASEHKGPEYPTWTEYFRWTGVLPVWSGHEILDHTPIPAEIAVKLGVEPRAGGHEQLD